jgi:D-glycero-alpha-D-manno-heptose-7-phosphate kinase
VRIDSSAPTRIDLAGGTFDIWPLYLISLRAHCSLTARPGHAITVVSDDTGESVDASSPDDLGLDRLPLLARLVRHFGARGLELRTRSESPVGAGIGGSSALTIAVAAALARWTDRALVDDELLAVAMNIEAQVLGVPTGVQDYRPAFYGGVSRVEMDAAGVRRRALRVDLDDLGQRVVVAYTGASRNSGINNWDVMARRINGDPAVIEAFDGIRDEAAGLALALEAGRWADVAGHVAREWHHRKHLAPGVTTPEIDQLLSRATAAGAVAGKVCGAGGGGCLFCLVDPARRDEVADALSAAGATVLPVAVDADGLRVTRR